jgi:hypothetical protein
VGWRGLCCATLQRQPKEILLKRISILLIAVLALVLAACGSDDAASVEPTDQATAEPTVEATPEPVESEAAEASDDADPSASEFAIPSFDLSDLGGDPELAGRFPTTVAGDSLEIQSFGGEFFAQMGGADPTFDEFLESVDAELSDVSVAFGGNADGTIGVAAFRIRGATAADLEEEFLNATQEAGDVENVDQRSVGGKDVWAAASTDETVPGSVYIYVQDDTVYFLTAPDDDVAGEILEALP